MLTNAVFHRRYYFPKPTSQLRKGFADASLPTSLPVTVGMLGGPAPAPPGRGFGLDLNGDGKFDNKNDGFLAFDLDRDGKYSNSDIQKSRDLLKAFSGNLDSDGNGQLTQGEWRQGIENFFRSRAMDLDRDGVLSNWELKKAGGTVLRSNPHFKTLPGSQWSSLGLDNLPGFRRLDSFDPWTGSYRSTSKVPFLSATDWRLRS